MYNDPYIRVSLPSNYVPVVCKVGNDGGTVSPKVYEEGIIKQLVQAGIPSKLPLNEQISVKFELGYEWKSFIVDIYLYDVNDALITSRKQLENINLDLLGGQLTKVVNTLVSSLNEAKVAVIDFDPDELKDFVVGIDGKNRLYLACYDLENFTTIEAPSFIMKNLWFKEVSNSDWDFAISSYIDELG